MEDMAWKYLFWSLPDIHTWLDIKSTDVAQKWYKSKQNVGTLYFPLNFAMNLKLLLKKKSSKNKN